MKKRNDSWGWTFWLTVITIISLCVAVIYGGLMVREAHSAPTEPPLESVERVEPHPSLGAVFWYSGGRGWSHAKKGAVQSVPDQQEPKIIVFPELGEVWYFTGYGILYRFWIEPNMFWNGLTFEPTIDKTWPCGCE